MSRAKTNWLFIAVVIAAAVLFRGPSRSMESPAVDHVVDLTGLLIAVVGLVIRVAARQWKVRRGAGGLVADGPYAIVRNPMYVGSFLAGAGVLVIFGSIPLAIAFFVCFGAFHAAVVRGEEKKLTEHFGDQYQTYMARTPRWLPSLYTHLRLPLPSLRSFFQPAAVLRERTAVAGTLIAASVSEVYADTVTEGWSVCSGEATLYLSVAALILVMWVVTKPLAKRLYRSPKPADMK